MNAVALWGDDVGVGAQDIHVNYNVDWAEKASLTLEYYPCFLVFLWCGFDGTAEGCVSVAQRLSLLSWSDILHQPLSLWDTFGFPESGKRHLFLGEETTMRQAGRSEGRQNLWVDRAVATYIGLQVEADGCGQAGSTYRGMFGFHRRIPAHPKMKHRWMVDWKERKSKRGKKKKEKAHREDWEKDKEGKRKVNRATNVLLERRPAGRSQTAAPLVSE